jgi:transcriptional regulator with XRE-family HTH domain
MPRCYQIDNMPSRILLSDWQTTPLRMEANITNMATKRAQLRITEWFKHRSVNDEKVGELIGVDRATIFRWRKEQHRLNPDKIAALAKALDVEPEELWRSPARRSLDALVKDSPDDVVSMAFDIVKRMAGGAQ